ncbi:MAG: helix-turn-helix domain-containing protein [Candidatus Gastranaerophilaceae bacterium]|jgi:sugar-specific transcriptional regulator TrmB
MIDELIKFGLSQKEAEIYIVALKSGSATVQQIAKKTSLNRITVHGIAEEMIKKGLIEEEIAGKKRFLKAASPAYFQDILINEKQKVAKKEIIFDNIFQKLTNIYNDKTSSDKIQYLNGLEGVKAFCRDVLTAKGETLEFARIETMFTIADDYIKNVYLPKKRKLQIPSRFLFVDTKEAKEYIQTEYLENHDSPKMQVKFIPKEEFEMSGYIVIWNDKVGFYSIRELKVILIQDRIIKDTIKSMFEFLWTHINTPTVKN